jgi:hypothetical protein
MPATGPISLDGKSTSARNSLKHGYSGDGRCLPATMEEEVAAAVASLEAIESPRNDLERSLIRQVALASVRIERLQSDLLALGDDRARRARLDWDARREDEVAELFRRLEEARDPAAVLRQLRRTTQGCERLADAWENLLGVLDRLGHWPDRLAYRALRLIGATEPPGLAAEAPELAAFCDAIADLQFHADPEAYRACERLSQDIETLRARFGDRDAALALLRAEAIAQRDAALARADDLWNAIDGPARDAAPRLARIDGVPEAGRLSRYLADADRLRNRALNELQRLRDQASTPASAGRATALSSQAHDSKPVAFEYLDIPALPPYPSCERPTPAAQIEPADEPAEEPAPRNELPAASPLTPPEAVPPAAEPPPSGLDTPFA